PTATSRSDHGTSRAPDIRPRCPSPSPTSRGRAGGPGTHVFASDGRWAFDFNGWLLERDLLAATQASYGTAYPGWSHDLVPLGSDLAAFCAEHAHQPPECFAHPPWPRAHDLISRFRPAPDPVRSQA